MHFNIDLSSTNDALAEVNEQILERNPMPTSSRPGQAQVPSDMMENARRQWAGKAVASYYTLGHTNALVQRLIAAGAPLELIGAATYSQQEAYRMAVLCGEATIGLGTQKLRSIESDELMLFAKESDPWVGIASTVLAVHGMNMSLSAPIFDALATVSTDDTVESICDLLVVASEEQAQLGWDMLDWIVDRLDSRQRAAVQAQLPIMMAAFERICFGGPETLEQLAGTEIVVEQSQANLGTLSTIQYAAIFYHVITEDIFPRLDELGFDSSNAWKQHHRLGDIQISGGLGVCAIDTFDSTK